MSSAIHSPSPEPGSWRLARFRRWHKWGGVTAALLLLVLGATGIVLNYKQPVFARLGIESKRGERDASPLPAGKSPGAVKFTTAAGIAGGKIDFAGALAIARAEWGDVPLERVELRSERGSVSYRFRKSGGAELWVDAADGTHLTKGEYERIGKAGADGVPTQQTDWGKILIDLHTGRIGGEVGKAVMSCAGLLLLGLTLSGVYLWVKPIFIRFQNARAKASGARVCPDRSAAVVSVAGKIR
jgi:uncharacterized iron-regulated membrane protein